MNSTSTTLLVTIILTFLSVNLNAGNIFDYEDDNYSIESQLDINDPLEEVNKKIFKFNYIIDKYSIRPMARLYNQHLPKPVQLGLKNFNTNLQKPLSSISSLMVLDFKNAFYNLRSFAINTSIGCLGIFDISEHLTNNETNQNFITVLDHYGISQGIYLVIPFIGPQTTRNFSGLILDSTLNPIYLYDYNKDYKSTLEVITTTITVIDLRANNFDTINDIYDNSFDPYITMRNIYYQTQ